MTTRDEFRQVVEKEKTQGAISGFVGLAAIVFWIALLAAVSRYTSRFADIAPKSRIIEALILIGGIAYILKGLRVLNPGRAVVITLLGQYHGTVMRNGFFWFFPLFRITVVDIRVVNLITPPLKVNDKNGNPIEIGAVVSYDVTRPAFSIFNIGQDVQSFVRIQAESVLRHLANEHVYEAVNSVEESKSLQGNTSNVAKELAQQLQTLVEIAGVRIGNVMINHLAYAPEVALSMLRRQQAGATLAARKTIVAGAVSVAAEAVTELNRALGGPQSTNDPESRRLAGNLMIVLCAENSVQQTIPLTPVRTAPDAE